jgi:hypothetical protein
MPGAGLLSRVPGKGRSKSRRIAVATLTVGMSGPAGGERNADAYEIS